MQNDNGILEFISVDRAIELYEKIENEGVPKLDWKFYGRRKPSEPDNLEAADDSLANSAKEEGDKKENDNNLTTNTEFDFDEEFTDFKPDTSITNESLQLKKRPEPGSEKKTNLSEIMSDIMKESHTDSEAT